tara:strand:+ start:605 stop:805 length:201 start_codon:yes stop_codon:yes gene_type:complete
MQTKPIYSLEDFEERLSELAVGTEDAQALTVYVRRIVSLNNWQQNRLQEAYRQIGSNLLDELMEYE